MNPRAALVWETRHDFTTKLLYGRAFRPPAFVELHAQKNPAAKGNPNLDPETIQTIELAFDYQPAVGFRTVVNLFAYEATDLIELIPDTVGSGSTARHARDQQGYGFELDMDWELSGSFRLRANCAWMSSEDKATSRPVANTPHVQFFVNPQWSYSDWSLDGQFKWIGDRERAEGDTRDTNDDYGLVGIALRRKNLWDRWDLSIGARNL